jgi:hypothetical protein
LAPTTTPFRTATAGGLWEGPPDAVVAWIPVHHEFEEDLHAGAFVVVADDRIRVRRLPLLHDE